MVTPAQTKERNGVVDTVDNDLFTSTDTDTDSGTDFDNDAGSNYDIDDVDGSVIPLQFSSSRSYGNRLINLPSLVSPLNKTPPSIPVLWSY